MRTIDGKKVHSLEDKMKTILDFYNQLFESQNPRGEDIDYFLDKISIPEITSEHREELDKYYTARVGAGNS